MEIILSSNRHVMSSSPVTKGNNKEHILLIQRSNQSESDVGSKTSATNRRSPIKSAPNLLNRCMLRKAVKKGVLPSEDRKKVCYSSPGHHCWSSLRIKEWQEFQRIVDEKGFDSDRHSSRNSYSYFVANSPHSASKASKRVIRRQMASPDTDYYSKVREKEFTRIEKAIGSIQFSKNQKRHDYLSGVPTEFLDKIQNEMQAGNEINNNQNENNKSSQLRFVTPNKPESEHPGQSTRVSTSKPHIPGLYVFPKPSDFVPAEGTKLTPVGVDWKYSKCHRSQSAQTSGRLIKTVRPVTEGLTRNGTSVSKIKGKALEQGEWNVKKVWNRNVDHDGVINTMQMARYDVSSNLIRNNKMKKMKQVTDVGRFQIDEDSLSMDAQSIDRADSDEEQSIFSD